MNEEIRIRQAKLYDVPAMARIDVAVAEYGEEKAGYGEIRFVAGEAQIYNIAIAPEFRRAGIGESLLRHMIAKAEDDGCVLVTLEVRGGNEAAMALYKKLGFREVGRRKGYYSKGGEDAVLMDLDLRRIEVEVEI